jgi:hypothetical protein
MNGRRNVLIFTSVVDTNNGVAIDRLIALIPNPAELQPLVRKRFAKAIYDHRTKRDYWIAGDGNHVVCLMITGIGLEEVPQIRTLLAAPDGRPLNLHEIATLAAQVTGGTAHLI